MFNRKEWLKQANIIADVLDQAPEVDRNYRLPPEEFIARQKNVMQMLRENGADCGIVYSNEHYCGDVPYLAGNNNIIVEPIAAVLGKEGLFFIAGLESGIVAEQLCHRSGVKIKKVDIHKIDEPDYSTDLLRPEQIIDMACGGKPKNIALLTSKYVLPVGLHNVLSSYIGNENILNLSKEYCEIKYEKSDNEMKLIDEACKMSDIIIEGMLSVLKPGMFETQLAQWGYCMAMELGSEDLGFPIMVTANKSNMTMVGRAMNNMIQEGDIVHIGVSPKRDGLCGAQRVSVVCTDDPGKIPAQTKMWFEFLEGAFQYSLEKFREIAHNKLEGCEHEKAMIEYYRNNAPMYLKKAGISVPDFALQKGYVSTHNSGYTECQEFFGACDLGFTRPLGRQIVTMIDVGLKGYGDDWSECIIPGLDYIVIEKTIGKFGNDVRVLNNLPINLQKFVGRGF